MPKWRKGFPAPRDGANNYMVRYDLVDPSSHIAYNTIKGQDSFPPCFIQQAVMPYQKSFKTPSYLQPLEILSESGEWSTVYIWKPTAYISIDDLDILSKEASKQ